MSYMGEIVILIQEAAEIGVTLEVSDFRTLEGRLMIDGMDADDWFNQVIRDQDSNDRLEDLYN
jgi:hypothetical protein